MHWKLKENIRLGKVCSSCKYGSYLNTISNQCAENPDFGLCCKNMACLENDWEGNDEPELSPRIRTCFDWRPEESNTELTKDDIHNKMVKEMIEFEDKIILDKLKEYTSNE